MCTKKKEEIAFLGEKMDEARVELKNHESMLRDLSNVEGDIKTRKAVLKRLNKEHEDIEAKISKAESKLSSLNTDAAEKKYSNAIAKLEKALEKFEKMQSQRSAEIRSSELELATLLSSIAIAQNNVQALLAEKTRLTKHVASNKSSADVLTDNISDLAKEKNSLTKEIILIEKERFELVKLKDAERAEVETITKRVNKARETLNSIVKATAEKKKEGLDEVKKEKAKLEEKEGDLTLREGWLSEKAIKLKKFKESLEEFFGKKININV